MVNTAKKPSATEALKTSSKRVIQKTTVATGDFIGNKIADKLQKSQRIYHRITQKKTKKKCLRKKIYIHNQDKKLLMI